MAYLFQYQTDGAYFTLGGDSRLYVTTDLSIGGWLQIKPSPDPFIDATVFLNQQNNFFGLDPIRLLISDSAHHGGSGYGIMARHEVGGGGFQGVTCIPGGIDPKYTWSPGNWFFFGFSRNSSTQKYASVFGGRTVMVLAQSASYTTAPVGTFGLGNTFNVGHSSDGIYLGPWSYWSRQLSISEWQQLAQCTLPTDTSGLLVWSKMNTQPAPVDLGPDSFGFTRINQPVFLADQGCAQFGAGRDYWLTSTGA